MSDLTPREILVAVRAALTEAARLHTLETKRIFVGEPTSMFPSTSAEKESRAEGGVKRSNCGSTN